MYTKRFQLIVTFIKGGVCLRTGALVLVAVGDVSARVAGKMGGYSNKMGGKTIARKVLKTMITLTFMMSKLGTLFLTYSHLLWNENSNDLKTFHNGCSHCLVFYLHKIILY